MLYKGEAWHSLANKVGMLRKEFGRGRLKLELGKQSWDVREELWAGEMCAEAGIESLGRF
jgi:hypothetical protein